MNILNSHILYLKTFPNQGQKKDKDLKDKALSKANLQQQFKDFDAEKQAKATKQLFDQIAKGSTEAQVGVEKLVGQQEKLGITLIDLAKKSTFLEQRNRELNKTFGINSGTAGELGEKYDSLGESFGTGGKQIRKYAQELNRLLPLQAKNLTDTDKANKSGFTFNSRLIKTAKLFRENLGLSAENVEGFARFTAGLGEAGGSTQDVAAQLTSFAPALEEATGLVGTTRTILQDVASLSSDVQLQFRNYPTQLGLAVLKTRMLGTSLGEVFSIGKNLLNIEQSVGNELEYQLLSGQRLVNQNGESLTQKFREATLMGDSEAIASSMNEILETQGDTIKDNFFARKKLAETLGISEEKLAGMVQQRELLEKAGPQAEKIMSLQGEKLAGAVDEFKKTATEDQLKAFDELVKGQANQLTTDEKMVYYLETLTTGLIGEQFALAGSQAKQIRETQAAFAGTTIEEGKGTLESVMNLPSELTGLSNTGLAETLGAFGDTANKFGAAADAFNATVEIIPIAGDLAKKAGDLANAAVFKGINSIRATTVESINIGTAQNINDNTGGGNVDQDFISRPGGEKISFSSKDTVVGAKPGGPIDQMLAMSSGGGGASIDYNAMAAAVASAMSNIQIVAPTDIYRDSEMNIQSIT
jgi:hypothetical protein